MQTKVLGLALAVAGLLGTGAVAQAASPWDNAHRRPEVIADYDAHRDARQHAEWREHRRAEEAARERHLRHEEAEHHLSRHDVDRHLNPDRDFR